MTMKEESNVLKTDVLGRVTVAKEKREEMLDIFEQSSMSGAEFARTHGVAVMTFASWVQKRRRARGDYEKEGMRRKLRMPKSVKAKKEKASQQKVNLIEVEVSSNTTQSSASCLEVVLPNATKILLSHESQIPLLKTLIRELSC